MSKVKSKPKGRKARIPNEQVTPCTSEIKSSKYCDARRAGILVDTLIIHCMYAIGAENPFDMVTCVEVLNEHKVSAHFLIGRDGDVYNLVDETRRAWHAGVSRMPFPNDKRENVNDFSIGIELIGSPEGGFTPKQLGALVDLTLELISRHPIKNVLGHEHIAPERKVDPGPTFDWKAYTKALGLRCKGKVLRFPVESAN